MTENYTTHTKPFKYKTSPLFDRLGIKHLFTTRSGGISRGVFASMNLAAGSGSERDDFENVILNHDICARVIGHTARDICRTYQEHTVNVACVGEADRGKGLFAPPFPEGTDGLATASYGTVLSIRAADCVPVIAADTAHGITGAVHSGWKGTLGNAAASLIEAMVSLGAEPGCIAAAVGPCIKACCYEVGEELYGAFSAAGWEKAFAREGGRLTLSLVYIVERQLIAAGLDESMISVCPDCTCCSEEYFSHRRMGVNRGTGGAFIVTDREDDK